MCAGASYSVQGECTVPGKMTSCGSPASQPPPPPPRPLDQPSNSLTTTLVPCPSFFLCFWGRLKDPLLQGRQTPEGIHTYIHIYSYSRLHVTPLPLAYNRGLEREMSSRQKSCCQRRAGADADARQVTRASAPLAGPVCQGRGGSLQQSLFNAIAPRFLHPPTPASRTPHLQHTPLLPVAPHVFGGPCAVPEKYGRQRVSVPSWLCIIRSYIAVAPPPCSSPPGTLLLFLYLCLSTGPHPHNPFAVIAGNSSTC